MTPILRTFLAAVLTLGGMTLIVASGPSSDGAPTFSKSFGGEYFDNVAAAIPTADGGYLFVGNRDVTTSNDEADSASSQSGDAVWAVKLDALGDIRWEKLIGDNALNSGGAGFNRYYSRVVAAAGGGAWLIGTEHSEDGSTIDLLVARLDEAGQVLWTRSYDSGWPAPDPYFYPSGNSHEGLGAVVETPEGQLWIAARATAFVKDTGIDDDENVRGVSMSTIYLMKLAADGAVITSRHVNVMREDRLGAPRAVRVLQDGGLALVSPEEDYNFVILTEPTGAIRSKTAIPDTFQLSVYGVFWATPIETVIPMRRNGIAGVAGDDGFIVVGRSGDDSAISRFLPGERNPDDPAEGAGSGEFLPRENQWNIEIPEAAEIWVAAARCGAAPLVNRRCGVIVAGKGRETEGDMLIANIDVDGNVSGLLRKVTGIEKACAMQQLDELTGDGRVAYRLLVATTDNRSGSLIVDDQLAVRQPFTEGAGPTCVRDFEVNMSSSGEWASVSRNYVTDAVEVSRTRNDNTARWRQSFALEGGGWVHALSVRQTDDDADGALNDGYLIAAETGTNKDAARRSALLLKLDREGTVSWQRTLPGLAVTDTGLRISSDALAVQSGRYLLVVHDESGGTRALGFDRNGAISWQRGLWSAGDPGARSAIALRDGGWLIGSGREVQRERTALMRLSGNGDVAWSRALADMERIDSIAESPNGEIVIGGYSSESAAFGKLDASGNPVWMRELQSDSEYFTGPQPVRVAVTQAGDILMSATIHGHNAPYTTAGVSGPLSGQDLIVHRYSTDGVQQWTRRFGGRYNDELASLQPTPDGGAIIGGKSRSLGDRSDRTEGWLLRIAPDGGVSSGCAAEQLGMDYPDLFVLSADITSAPLDRAGIGARDDATLPLTAASSLQPYLTTTPTVEARHCSGRVPRAPGGGGPVAQLRVIQGGTITGVVSSLPAGIICGTGGGGDCEENFDQGLLVTLDVDPGSRSTFESWTGCDVVDGTQCQVRMSADRTVTVTFSRTPRPPNVNLILTAVSGRGTVTGTGGINCRPTTTGTCSSTLTRGSTAQLTATPDSGRSFLGWEGSCSAFGNTRSIALVMNEGQTCGARFTGPPPGAPTVTVQFSGAAGGNVTSDPVGIDCGAANSLCTEGFAIGTDVTLTAEATLPGFEFQSFLCQGTGTVYDRTVTLEGLTTATTCEATFSEEIERLHLRIVRDQRVGGDFPNDRFYVDGGGLDCRTDCDRPFLRDQMLILRAEPSTQFYVSGWSGCEAVYPDNTHPRAYSYCQVRMDRRRDVVAFLGYVGPGPNTSRSLLVNFTPGSTPAIVTSIPGPIDCDPSGGICIGNYTIAQQVRLNIEPRDGSTLMSHAGCDTFTPASGGTLAQCLVTMSADRAVTFGLERPDNPPVAAFSYEPANPVAGQPVTFDASASSDDNAIAGYSWQFFDNGAVQSTASVASHTYATAGTYTVRLTVTDSNGVTDDEVRTVVVTAAGPATPVITQQPQNVTVDIGVPAPFSVIATGPGPLSYRWLRDGINVQEGSLASYTTAPVTTADDGDVIQVVVTNSAGSTTSSIAVITVGRGWRVAGGTIASPAFRPSLALDASNMKYVSYAAPLSSGLGHGIFVEQLNGAGWTLVGGGAVDPLGEGSAQEQMLVIGADGLPVVGWVDATRVRVARWTGTQWSFIGNDITVDTTDFASLSNMQIVRDGADLVVAWNEVVGFPIPDRRIAVKRYSAATDTWSGGYVPDVTDAINIRMALDASGLPAIAYVPQSLSGTVGAIRVVRQGATGWAPFGGDVGPVPVANSSGFAGVYGFDIHFNAANVPIVFGSVDGIRLFAFRNSAGTWQPLTGTDGVFVSLDPVNESTALMAFTRSGSRIAVGYTRTQRQSNGGLRFITEFLGFDGTAWLPIGEPLSFVSYSISPQLDTSGNPIFAADYRSAGSFNEVVVQQFLP